MRGTSAEKRKRERTGRHLCANCLKEIPSEEYFGGDFYCAECAKKAEEVLDAAPRMPKPSEGET